MEIAIGGEISGRNLLDLAHENMRVRHLAYRTEQVYLQRIRRYVPYHHCQQSRILDLYGGGPQGQRADSKPVC